MNRRYTAMQQLCSLRASFKGHHWVIRRDGFTWWFEATPSVLSSTYMLKVVYNLHCRPEVYVVSPKPLRLAQGATRLPHTYDTKKQKLCLYSPMYREWNETMLISKTIIHWTLEWLLYYEQWAFSGVWHGGGHGSWDAIPNDDSNIV